MPVSHCQRLSHRPSNLENLSQRHRPLAKQFGQSFPFQELHHEIISSILRADVIEMTDIGVVQGRNGSGLTFHALLQFRRGRKM
jgi:hypothetical protein